MEPKSLNNTKHQKKAKFEGLGFSSSRKKYPTSMISSIEFPSIISSSTPVKTKEKEKEWKMEKPMPYNIYNINRKRNEVFYNLGI